MKKLLALILVLGIVLSGCSSNSASETVETVALLPQEDPTSATLSPEEELPTEEAAFGLSYMPQYGLNPFTCAATINRSLFSLLYESLFVVTHDFTASPVLCKSVESSSDGTFYRFTLLENAKFSDGTPLTAEDVKASILAAQKSAMYKERLEDITSLYVPESKVLEITLSTSYENFALLLDIPVVKASTVEADRPIGPIGWRTTLFGDGSFCRCCSCASLSSKRWQPTRKISAATPWAILGSRRSSLRCGLSASPCGSHL